MRYMFKNASALAIGAYIWMLLLVTWTTYHHLYVHQDYPKPQLSINDRLDALGAENEVIVQDLKNHYGMTMSLKGLIYCYHPDSTAPDPDTMVAVDWEIDKPLPPIGMPPHIISIPPVELGEKVDWSFCPTDQPLPDSVKRTKDGMWWKLSPGSMWWIMITDSLEVRQWWNTPPHDQGGE